LQLFRLAWKNIRGSGFRSIAILLAVMGVAGFLLATTLIIQGSKYSLDSGLQRLGADIIVVPQDAESKVESALLMGKPTNVWMPESNIKTVAAVRGVEAVSPQVYLSSLYGAACCSVSEMFIVVYDPETDFTITPWLKDNLGRGLVQGEVIGGCYIFVPPDDQYIKLYGSKMTLKGNLAPTGTGIDQTLFMTSETARALAISSVSLAEQPLVFPENQISTIMVRVTPNSDVHKVALTIFKDTKGLWPIESPQLFGTFRSQMNGLLWGFFAITLVVWILAMVLIGIIFSMAANERRREMAILRALGAKKSFIFRLVLSEAALMGLSGAIVGIFAAGGLIFIMKDFIAGSLKMPFLFPSIASFIGLFGAGIAFSIIAVSLAALLPAYRISRQEPAIAMRE
jgi:putative ABC transport system permease protein